jgi:hypothetical protein
MDSPTARVRKVINEAGRSVNCLRGQLLMIKSSPMNERQQAHLDYYLQRLEHWMGRKPTYSTARLLAARDADEAHPLRTEEEATEVVEHLWRLERGEATAT